MTQFFKKGFKPKSTTREAKEIIRNEMLSHFNAKDYGVKNRLDAIKIDAKSAWYQGIPDTDYHKGANLVQNGSFACYYSDQKIMLGKIYGKENVDKWDGQKTHETYKHLIAREYSALVKAETADKQKKITQEVQKKYPSPNNHFGKGGGKK
jgi:hypothetical protein